VTSLVASVALKAPQPQRLFVCVCYIVREEKWTKTKLLLWQLILLTLTDCETGKTAVEKRFLGGMNVFPSKIIPKAVRGACGCQLSPDGCCRCRIQNENKCTPFRGCHCQKSHHNRLKPPNCWLSTATPVYWIFHKMSSEISTDTDAVRNGTKTRRKEKNLLEVRALCQTPQLDAKSTCLLCMTACQTEVKPSAKTIKPRSSKPYMWSIRSNGNCSGDYYCVEWHRRTTTFIFKRSLPL